MVKTVKKIDAKITSSIAPKVKDFSSDFNTKMGKPLIDACDDLDITIAMLTAVSLHSKNFTSKNLTSALAAYLANNLRGKFSNYVFKELEKN